MVSGSMAAAGNDAMRKAKTAMILKRYMEFSWCKERRPGGPGLGN
jgi:hypothetical protein